MSDDENEDGLRQWLNEGLAIFVGEWSEHDPLADSNMAAYAGAFLVTERLTALMQSVLMAAAEAGEDTDAKAVLATMVNLIMAARLHYRGRIEMAMAEAGLNPTG